jgi:diguanylate cyclase (GGDEF)-like protein
MQTNATGHELNDTPLEVLLVEDEPTSAAATRNTLIQAGYAVQVATDGVSAVELLHRRRLPVVISDWRMPRMNGLELLRAVRRLETVEPVYFLMLTARDQIDDLEQVFAEGADDYLAKPVDPRELLARLRAASRTIRLRDQLQRQHREAHLLNAQLHLVNEQLAHAARHDALTGLPNRRAALELLERCWDRSGEPLSVLMIDVDGLKRVNDTLGHEAGDDLLCRAADLLREAAGDAATTCRLAGDEFVVVAPSTTAAGGRKLAARLLRHIKLAGSAAAEADVPAVRMSIGVAARTRQHRNVDELLADADRSMYRVKSSGQRRSQSRDGQPPQPRRQAA